MKAGRKPPRFPPESSEGSPLETVGLVALGALVVFGAALWVAGEVSGRVFGGSWPDTGVAEMGGVLARFGGHAADPARAWPAPARELIPGPVAFYLTLVLALAPVVGVGLYVLRRRLRSENREATARWARSHDLGPLVVSRPL
ncbi:MAG: hypothetical protein ACRDOP_16325, partial [Gaiellaceae bacterium]